MPLSDSDDIIIYMRRYLVDPTAVNSPGPAVTEPVTSEDALSAYFRRYLDDPA